MKRSHPFVRAAFVGAVVATALLVVAEWLIRPAATALPEPGAVLDRVTIVNPGLERLPDRTIAIEGDVIASIEPPPDAPAPKGAAGKERAASGPFVLPGLVDMHVHQPPDTPLGDVELFHLLYLAHGVTSVRDTGSFDGRVLENRKQIRARELIGPRTFACGPILDGDPPFWPGSRVVRDASEGRAVVAELAKTGVDCIKVYERLSPEALEGIKEEAEARSLPVIGHVPRAVAFSVARLDDVQHLTGVVEPDEPLTPARRRAIVTSSAIHGIAHTPTLVAFDRMSRLIDYAAPDAASGEPMAFGAKAARLLPRYYRDVLWDPRRDPRFADLRERGWDEMRETIQNAKSLVLELHRAGVRIHAGTDTMLPYVVPGQSLHEELRELVDAGLTPEAAWVAATRHAAEALRAPGLGVVRVGSPADLLVFRADPTRDLAALDTLEAVVAQGMLFQRADLDREIERRRRHFESPLRERASLALARWIAPAPQMD